MFKDLVASTLISAITMAIIITMACSSKPATEDQKPVVVNDEEVMTMVPADMDATPVATMDATPVVDATTVGPNSKDATPVM